MKRYTFEITIDASQAKVWNTLWDDETYSLWTAPFCEGSHAETDWNEGNKVLFLGPDGNGMVSRIKMKRPNEFMSFEHLGIVVKGVENTDGDEVKEWSGALENYTLETVKGKTHLLVETDIAEKYEEEFKESWPAALKKVKELSE